MIADAILPDPDARERRLQGDHEPKGRMPARSELEEDGA